MPLHILPTKPESDYELIDSGEGEKLERYGSVILSRPDPQALWPKVLPQKEWNKAVAQFSKTDEKAGWKVKDGVPERWDISFGGLNFWIKPSAFKHTGIFPEQRSNWQWIAEQITNAPSSEKISVLNLFGYTGGASLAAAKVGAEVCHVDGSKTAITTARENAELSGLGDKPIRWILDDAKAFVKREIKRGRKYHGIIMDPPSFGRGPKGEVWKIEENFVELLTLIKKVLVDDPQFILVNGYAAGYSALAYENTVRTVFKEYGGVIEAGELVIQESTGKRVLPAGIYVRWHKK